MNKTLTGDVQFENGEIGISQCVWCRHRNENGRRCRAFPKGIPEAILNNRHDHQNPYDGDYGVRYEPEVVEIEFVDVEAEDDFVPVSAELAVAMGSTADLVQDFEPESVDERAEIIAFDIPTIEIEDVDFELCDTASG